VVLQSMLSPLWGGPLALCIFLCLFDSAVAQDGGLGAGYDPVYSLSSGGRSNYSPKKEVSNKKDGFEEWLKEKTVSQSRNLMCFF
jgi:hypothetical protein